MKRIDIFVHVTCYPETMPMSRAHCQKTLLYFQNKAVYRAEDRPADICLKITLPDEGKYLKFLILVFFMTPRT